MSCFTEFFFVLCQIVDPNQVYDTINLGRRIDVLWPSQTMRNRGGKSFWKTWLPESGMHGLVRHLTCPVSNNNQSQTGIRTVNLARSSWTVTSFCRGKWGFTYIMKQKIRAKKQMFSISSVHIGSTEIRDLKFHFSATSVTQSRFQLIKYCDHRQCE